MRKIENSRAPGFLYKKSIKLEKSINLETLSNYKMIKFKQICKTLFFDDEGWPYKLKKKLQISVGATSYQFSIFFINKFPPF